MKINTTTKKPYAIIAVTIAVLLVSGISLAIWQPWSESNQQNSAPNDQAVGVSRDQVPEDTESSDAKAPLPSKSGTTNTDTPASNEEETTNTTQPEKPQVTRAKQSGETITVVALFQNESSGNCELTLNKNGEAEMSYDADITVGPSYYSCSFRIPRDQFSVNGEWKAIVSHNKGTASASSDVKIVEVL